MKNPFIKILPSGLFGLTMFLSCGLAVAECIKEQVSADDPERSTTSIPRPKGEDCVELIFPDDVLTWQVNVTVTRELPELAMSLSSPGKPVTPEVADDPGKAFLMQRADDSMLAISNLAQACENRPDVESIEKCWTDAANAFQAVSQSANMMLNSWANLQDEPPTNCADKGLSDHCIRRIELDPLNLDHGDRAVVAVQFSQQADPKTTETAVYEYQVPARGQFRAGVGAMFAFGSEDEFFSRPGDDGFLVDSGPGDDLGMNVAITANWINYNAGAGKTWNSNIHPFLGVGTDSDEISVFGGFAYTFHRGWSVNLGVAAVKENRLSASFELGQSIAESLDSGALTNREYKFRPFVGVSWTQPKAK